MLKGIVKAAVVAKVLDIARRELSKPENQRKAKEMIGRLAGKTKR
ncbi:MAG TPA: hypothetical protein VGD72_11930 [Mycobacteriales bacterium]